MGLIACYCVLCFGSGLQRKHAAYGNRVLQNSGRDGGSSSASPEEHPSVPLRRDPRPLQPTDHSLTELHTISHTRVKIRDELNFYFDFPPPHRPLYTSLFPSPHTIFINCFDCAGMFQQLCCMNRSASAVFVADQNPALIEFLSLKSSLVRLFVQ